jgi:NAD(P)-dependent dehydrogenase (short-subunit alcohol dehydrogenase family)
MAAGNQIRFDDRVVIVTGAGAGLGKVYALEFAKRGAKVVVNDLGGARDGTGASSSAADNVVKEIKDAGGEAAPNYDNVATPEGGENIVKTAIDAFGKVDVVVNNAGILRDTTFLKLEPSNWNAVINVHLTGAYCVSRPAFIKMKEQGYGRILLTSSGAGLYGNFGQSNYSSAKLGLVGLMNTLKLEGAKYNIKVNTIAPIAASRLTEDVLPPEMLEKLKPEFVAPLVLNLCSEGCTDSGMIFNCAMGYYNRAAVLTGPGAVVGGGEIPTPEQIAGEWDKIKSMEGAKEYGQLPEQVMDLMTVMSK